MNTLETVDHEHTRVERKQRINLYMKQIMMQKMLQAPFVKADFLPLERKSVCQHIQIIECRHCCMTLKTPNLSKKYLNIGHLSSIIINTDPACEGKRSYLMQSEVNLTYLGPTERLKMACHICAFPEVNNCSGLDWQHTICPLSFTLFHHLHLFDWQLSCKLYV